MPSCTWMFSLKVILISAGAISIAMAVKFSVPSIMAFALYEVPSIWTTLLSWLKPPYLYFIINGIIITIAASTLFQHRADNSEYSNQTQPLISAKTPPLSPPPSHPIPASMTVRPVIEEPPMLVYETEEDRDIVVLKPVVVNGIKPTENDEAHGDEMEDDGELLISSSECNPTSPPQQMIPPDTQLELLRSAEEKPLLSSTVGQRKRGSEGRKALRLATPTRQETLESTWKMITEGHHVPPTGHLKKLDTLENHGRDIDVNALGNDDSLERHMLKSETFRDRTNYDPLITTPVSWSRSREKIKKELSLGQEELNRRVEAFIKKFNEEMRLQRQESLNRYMEMINRGAD